MARAKALLLLCLACSLAAQGADTSYFETVAGSNQVGDGGPAQSAQISDCQGVAVDRFGAIYNEIDKLEKSEADVKKFTEYRELFGWLLSPGLGLVLVEVLLRNTVLRRIP